MDRVLRTYFKYRQQRIAAVLADPFPYQERILGRILKANRHTAYGRALDFEKISSYRDYCSAVPVVDYESIYPYIARMMEAEPKVLVSDPVSWFAKSSGTTNDRSKYLPITRNYLTSGHLKCTWFTASAIYNEDPGAKLFKDKNLIMVGSLEQRPQGITVGDISAIMLHHYPKIGRGFSTPDIEIALIPDWDEKISRIAELCIHERVTLLGGVPTWTLVLFKEILRRTGTDNILEVWPHLKSYMHGGVGFGPYRKTFDDYLPGDQVVYREIYNASEGYFAVQNNKAEDGMALLCDHAIFYEFLPYGESADDHKNYLTLREVEMDQKYEMIITTASGLYRYAMGDVITFVSTLPYKIKVLGRTQEYLNVFGEELMVANTDQALTTVAERHGAVIQDYTVAPLYMDTTSKGGHQWAIEFLKRPASVMAFSNALDAELRLLNSDYDAKRYKDMAMLPLELIVLEHGSVERWQRQQGKYGRQHKLPRLRNDRGLMEMLIENVEL